MQCVGWAGPPPMRILHDNAGNSVGNNPGEGRHSRDSLFCIDFHFSPSIMVPVTVSMMALGVQWPWIVEGDHGWRVLVAIHLLLLQR
jgi:hypothetical protein